MLKICFIGHKGVGKSTLSRCFSKKKSLTMVDIDEKIIESTRYKSIKKCYSSLGESSFRKYEYDCIKQYNTSQILSPGAGCVEYKPTRTYIKSHYIIIFLSIEFKEWIDLIKNEGVYLGRNMTDINLKHIYERREKYFHELANIRLENNRKEVIDDIIEELEKVLLF